MDFRMEESRENDDDIYSIRRKTSMFCPYTPERPIVKDKDKKETKEKEPKKNKVKQILTKVFGF